MKKLFTILLLFIGINTYGQGYIGFEGGFNVNTHEPNICVKALIGRIELNTISQVINFTNDRITEVVCFGGGYLLPKMITVGGGIGTMKEMPERITLYADRGWSGTVTGCLYIRKYFDMQGNVDLTASVTAIHKVGIVLGIGISIGYFKEEYDYLK